MGHIDRLTERDIEASLRVRNTAARPADDLDNPIGLTLSQVACISFFRQHPDTDGSDGDYYLSKFYQFLVLAFRAACDPDSDEHLHITYPLYRALSVEVESLPPDLADLAALQQFDYFTFQSDIRKAVLVLNCVS